jgi:hypothetical protein
MIPAYSLTVLSVYFSLHLTVPEEDIFFSVVEYQVRRFLFGHKVRLPRSIPSNGLEESVVIALCYDSSSDPANDCPIMTPERKGISIAQRTDHAASIPAYAAQISLTWATICCRLVYLQSRENVGNVFPRVCIQYSVHPRHGSDTLSVVAQRSAALYQQENCSEDCSPNPGIRPPTARTSVIISHILHLECTQTAQLVGVEYSN